MDVIGQEGRPVLPLPEFGILIASGRDNAKFLQAQLTNDIDKLSQDRTMMAAWCDPKGRTLALFTLCRIGDDIALVAPRTVIEQHLPRLRMYVLRAKVTLVPSTDRVVCGVVGPSGAALLRQHLPQPPASGAAVHLDETTVLGLLGDQRWLLICSRDAPPAWISASSDVDESLQNQWALAGVEAGAPSVVEATTGEFVPQMLNLEAVDGVSFSKGCYPGQEIVARTQYLGRIKRRMLRLQSEGVPGVLPAAGDEVRDATGRKIGLITATARDPSSRASALAVLRVDDVANGPLKVGDDTYAVVPLPYALGSDKSAG